MGKQKKGVINKSSLYIILWIVYYLQNIIFGRAGSSASRLIILVLILWSTYLTIYAVGHYVLPKYLKGLFVLLMMFSIYGVLYLLFPNNSSQFNKTSFNYLQGILISILPVFVFYVFTKEGLITRSSIQLWAIVFILVAVLMYYDQYALMLRMAADRASDSEEFTNNIGYYFLYIFPLLVFLSDKRLLQIIALVVVTAFILLSMKRGAILICALCLILFASYLLKVSKGVVKFRTIVLVSLFIVGCFWGIMHLMETSDYFQYRLESTMGGDSSGRDLIYSSIVDYLINQKSVFNILFGNGANYSLTISGNYAHNDWLEILVNQGIIGFLVYLVYFILFFLTIRHLSWNIELKYSLILIIVICFVSSLFSMSYGAMTIFLTLGIGYIFGCQSIKSIKSDV